MILSAASGNGNATVTYKIEANPAISERTGTVMIDSQVFLVTQAGINCTYKISPTTRTHGFAATSGIVTVTAGSNCAWSVVNTNDWLMITSGATGIGNGSIGYNVAPNLTNVARMGFVTVADQVLALTQRGATNGFIFETIAVLDGGPVRVRMAGAPAGVWARHGHQHHPG